MPDRTSPIGDQLRKVRFALASWPGVPMLRRTERRAQRPGRRQSAPREAPLHLAVCFPRFVERDPRAHQFVEGAALMTLECIRGRLQLQAHAQEQRPEHAGRLVKCVMDRIKPLQRIGCRLPGAEARQDVVRRRQPVETGVPQPRVLARVLVMAQLAAEETIDLAAGRCGRDRPFDPQGAGYPCHGGAPILQQPAERDKAPGAGRGLPARRRAHAAATAACLPRSGCGSDRAATRRHQADFGPG